MITVTTQLEVETCISCGVAFGVPPDWKSQRRQDKRTFYCPNGHPMVYTKNPKDTEIATLKAKLDMVEREKRWAESDRDGYRKDRDRLKHKLAATKGVLTRTKRRVGNGTCPCCGIGFPNLREHMNEQHPEYKAPLPTEVVHES